MFHPRTQTYSFFSLILSTCTPSHLKFITGKGRKYREIYIVKRVQVIRRRKCQGFIGLHNFSGADWGGKFVGISKKTLADAYMALDEDDPATECFQNHGTGLIPTELIYGELPPQLEGLERFVCHVYCLSDPVPCQRCDGKCFALETLKETAYLLHVLPFFPMLHAQIT